MNQSYEPLNMFQQESKFPKICDQSVSEMAFCLLGDDTLYLVYEAHRDYLSTPRMFVELRVHLNEDKILCTGGLLLSEAEEIELQQLEYGVYTRKSDTTEDDVRFCDAQYFLVYSPKTVLEFHAAMINLHKTHYHQRSANAVLAGSLQGSIASLD